LDRATADVGNGHGSNYTICYPESCGGGVIASGKSFPASSLLPKEKWMINTLKSELEEGRNVLVLGWHVDLLPRLSRIITRELGVEAVVLPDKVPTLQRRGWIQSEIVEKKRRILITNPVRIQTGINNLVHFSSQIWHENPCCNPIVYRQGIGRIDRIGQNEETRVHFPIYSGTLQSAAFDLLLQKVAVSTATDGLDPESVLLAAGGGENSALAGLSLGRHLWSLLDQF
jgi:hypothetical protein